VKRDAPPLRILHGIAFIEDPEEHGLVLSRAEGNPYEGAAAAGRPRDSMNFDFSIHHFVISRYPRPDVEERHLLDREASPASID